MAYLGAEVRLETAGAAFGRSTAGPHSDEPVLGTDQYETTTPFVRSHPNPPTPGICRTFEVGLEAIVALGERPSDRLLRPRGLGLDEGGEGRREDEHLQHHAQGQAKGRVKAHVP